ncbi:TlpA disulfide reductase family protein [Methylovulum miyakonense]|uniref:TlpA disulfide reductase family protein n=1 Tax=Methylovulum miyakonense TaxID=645578 RepID=UPI00036446D0|nr:TlpA disulfide reductase family protein [Methylovulum miyakonense]
MPKAQIGQPAPPLPDVEWVQGKPVNFDELSGNVVLLEVFQVNCPGCFIYSLPQAIGLHQRHHPQGLTVLGIATAFEDFDKNTLENLRRLLQKGEAIGATRQLLAEYGQLVDGGLPYRIPFPVAMDHLQQQQGEASDSEITDFLDHRFASFQQQPAIVQQQTREHVRQYLHALAFRAATFELFGLQGTPSQLLVDKRGILRASKFGHYPGLEADVQALLRE